MLALCERRLATDWPARFGHALLLLETFVDPARHRGTVYRAANWTGVGRTRGFRRVRGGYGAAPAGPKLVFVRPLVRDARAHLTRPALDPIDRHGGPHGMIAADTMRSLPDFFADLDDPRRRQGRRHPLAVVLAIAAGATLCGARGYKAMAEWAADLSPRARERFRCRHRGGRHEAPSADTAAAATRRPASSSSATCWCASIPTSSTAPCSASTPRAATRTTPSPLTARPCATPSTPTPSRPLPTRAATDPRRAASPRTAAR